MIDARERMRRIMDEHENEMLFLQHQMKCFEALTEKRMQMVEAIRERHPSSIRELADFLSRDIKNVFDDLRVLDHMGVIRFVIVGRKKKPVVARKFIVISLE